MDCHLHTECSGDFGDLTADIAVADDSAQTFIPLEGKAFVVVLAPPNDDELPDLDQVRAFLFDGSCGFTMKKGTWHEFPFALVDGSNVIVILRSETARNLMKENVIDGEAHGPDLDKKNLVVRTGVTLEVKM